MIPADVEYVEVLPEPPVHTGADLLLLSISLKSQAAYVCGICGFPTRYLETTNHAPNALKVRFLWKMWKFFLVPIIKAAHYSHRFTISFKNEPDNFYRCGKCGNPSWYLETPNHALIALKALFLWKMWKFFPVPLIKVLQIINILYGRGTLLSIDEKAPRIEEDENASSSSEATR